MKLKILKLGTENSMEKKPKKNSILINFMTLTDKEKIVAIISNGIAVFALLQEKGDLPENTSMYDFVLKVVPEEIKSELSIELIDEIFQYVSTTHSS